MSLAVICFIVFLFGVILFIYAGYVSYKNTGIIDELWMGFWWATIAAMGCVISGIRMYIGN